MSQKCPIESELMFFGNATSFTKHPKTKTNSKTTTTLRAKRTHSLFLPLLSPLLRRPFNACRKQEWGKTNASKQLHECKRCLISFYSHKIEFPLFSCIFITPYN
jgi:hypothetical protein